MKLASFEAIVQALNKAEVRFIVVGGLAVIAHGYGRVTRDVDLVIQLQPDTITKAFRALEELGYFPRVPISAAQFADPSLRAEWIREKGMQVLNFHSDAHRETPVYLFVIEPFDFGEEYRAALLQESSPGVVARILRLDSLLQMKAEAGGGKDLADIDELNLLHGRNSSYDKCRGIQNRLEPDHMEGQPPPAAPRISCPPIPAKTRINRGVDDHGRRTLEWRKARGLPYIDPFTGESVRGSAARA